MSNAIQKFQASKHYNKLGDVWLVGMGATKLKTMPGSAATLLDADPYITDKGIIVPDGGQAWLTLGNAGPETIGMFGYTSGWGPLYIFVPYIAPYGLNVSTYTFASGMSITAQNYPDWGQIVNYPKPILSMGTLMDGGQAGFFRNGELKATMPDDGYRLPANSKVFIETKPVHLQMAGSIVQPFSEQDAAEFYEDIKKLMLGIGIAAAPPVAYRSGKKSDQSRSQIFLPL